MARDTGRASVPVVIDGINFNGRYWAEKKEAEVIPLIIKEVEGAGKTADQDWAKKAYAKIVETVTAADKISKK